MTSGGVASPETQMRLVLSTQKLLLPRESFAGIAIYAHPVRLEKEQDWFRHASLGAGRPG
jgi:hypothetical protein